MSKNNEVKTTDTEFDLSVRSKAKTKAKQTKTKKAETDQVEAELIITEQAVAEQTAVEQAESKVKSTLQKPKSHIIKLDELVPFDNHPYKVTDDDSMDELVESIREHGILNPLIVRPIEGIENSYEIISGHNVFMRHRGWD